MPADSQDPVSSNIFDDELPAGERLGLEEGEVAPLDSEIDFDDEAESDQAPLDEVEADEAGVKLDDPEDLDDSDDL